MPDGDANKTPENATYRVYTKEGLKRELRQAEIISNLIQHRYDSVADNVEAVVHPYVIVATQDCDLLHDYETQANDTLLYEAQPAIDVRPTLPPGSEFCKRVALNTNERYHLLQSVHSDDDCIGEGIPAVIVDFRRLFTLPVIEIYRQFAKADGAKRRCRLEMPYREHFQMRAAFYFQRVMLPEPHKYKEASATTVPALK